MTGQNRVKVWRMPDLQDAKMLKGDYLNYACPWHAHDEMILGVVMEGGAVRLRTRSREGTRGNLAPRRAGRPIFSRSGSDLVDII
jgi:hypothetical protein